MTVEELFAELEQLLSDIAFSGLKNVPPALLQKLEKLQKWTLELGMPHGGGQISGFVHILRAYRLGEAELSQAAGQLCALEFYCKNVLGNMDGREEREE